MCLPQRAIVTSPEDQSCFCAYHWIEGSSCSLVDEKMPLTKPGQGLSQALTSPSITAGEVIHHSRVHLFGVF